MMLLSGVGMTAVFPQQTLLPQSTSLPSVTVTDCTDCTDANCTDCTNGWGHEGTLGQQGVEAQDLSELRRMTCPVGGLYGDCPNLKALAVSCRQANQLCLSTSDVHSTLRRHSDDVDGRGRAYWLRLAKSHLIGGYQTLKARLSPSRDLEFLDEGRRCLSVEFATAKSATEKRKCKSSEDVSKSTKEDLKHPQRNMSSSLVIHSLKEGRLCAEISLGDCPDDDDVIVRIRNYTLDILLQKKGSGKKSGSKSGKESPDRQPYKLGAVDIPIYLDPETLCFDLIDNRTLIMEGETKTCMPRGRVCHSTEDMDKLSRSRSPFGRRKSSTTWYANSQSERPGFFRQRSYTN